MHCGDSKAVLRETSWFCFHVPSQKLRSVNLTKTHRAERTLKMRVDALWGFESCPEREILVLFSCTVAEIEERQPYENTPSGAHPEDASRCIVGIRKLS